MLTILAVLLALQQPPVRDAATPDATLRTPGLIAGRVIVRDSKPVQPVRRARVTVTGERLRQPEVVDTDADGRFTIQNLAPGNYRLTVSKPGFVTLEAGATRFGERAAPVAVSGGKPTEVNVALPRGSAIDGQIRNDAGEPVPDVVVSAVRFTHVASTPRAGVIRETRTDDRGRYRLHSLPDGNYFVQAAPDPLVVDQYSGVPGERGSGIARTFYPGAAQVHEARAVSIQAGREAANVDFTIATVPLARVMGRVIDSSGKAPAVPALGFRLRPVSGLPISVSGIMTDNGGFHLGSVPPGDYWMMATVQTSPAATTEFAVTRVTVAGQDLADLTLTTAPGAVLEGRVEAESGPGPPLKGVRVTPVSLEYELPPTRTTMPPITPASDGTVKINGIFGPKLLRLAGLPDGWALKSVSVDGADITDVPTDFRPSSAVRALRIVITDKTGAVTGTVWAGERQVSGYQVVLFSPDERSWREGSRFITVISPQPDGSFTVSGLLPGDYLAAAVPVLDDGAATDADLLGKLRGGATRVTLAEGATQMLKLQLQVPR